MHSLVVETQNRNRSCLGSRDEVLEVRIVNCNIATVNAQQSMSRLIRRRVEHVYLVQLNNRVDTVYDILSGYGESAIRHCHHPELNVNIRLRIPLKVSVLYLYSFCVFQINGHACHTCNFVV